MLTPIEKLTPLTPISPEKKAPEGPSSTENVKETDADFKEAQYLLATGQLDNPAMAMIAASKSQSAVSLLIQLRNKAQDAYSELMRISL